MKRFYKLVTIYPLDDGAHEIHLDGKPVKLPSGGKLLAPNAVIAMAMQAEWAAQDKDIKPNSMPLTQILTTALDRVRMERPAMQVAVTAYLDTDLLCYRTELPAPVAARQAELWNPWLEWFARTYGMPLKTSYNLAALRQPAAAHAAVEKTVALLDDLHFTILQLTVSISASLVLGLAFIVNAATPEQIFAAMHAEEDYKGEIYSMDRYGFAPHEEKARRETLADLTAAAFIRDHI